jgi:hypothetical protein
MGANRYVDRDAWHVIELMLAGREVTVVSPDEAHARKVLARVNELVGVREGDDTVLPTTEEK